jgi:hypothetical protein
MSSQCSRTLPNGDAATGAELAQRVPVFRKEDLHLRFRPKDFFVGTTGTAQSQTTAVGRWIDGGTASGTFNGAREELAIVIAIGDKLESFALSGNFHFEPSRQGWERKH